MEGDLRPDDLVQFVGPQSSVLNWPATGEHGAVQALSDCAVRVVWERSTLVMAWPLEWIQRGDTELLDSYAGGLVG